MATQLSFFDVSPLSNLVYLPLMYFLPEELIVRCPTLRALPRKVRKILYDDDNRVIIDSEPFENELIEAVSFLVFPHFGVRGWKEHYTGNCPLWKLSYLTKLWAQLLDREIGWGLQRLLLFPSYMEIPFYDTDYIKGVYAHIVKLGIVVSNLQPVFDVVHEMPCEEDFEKVLSPVRIDFLRYWYHTRTKIGLMDSLEESMERGDRDFYSVVPAGSCDLTRIIASEDYCQRFKKRLSERDLEILELREDGFTFEEIAEKLNYKTHSGVVKRMQAIRKEFLKYESEQK